MFGKFPGDRVTDLRQLRLHQYTATYRAARQLGKSRGHALQGDGLVDELLEIEGAADITHQFPHLDSLRVRGENRINPDQIHRPRDEGIDGGAEVGARDEPTGRHRRAVAQRAKNLMQGVSTDAVNGPRPSLRRKYSVGFVGDLVTADDVLRAQLVESVMVAGRAGRGDHSISRVGQECDGEGAHTSRGARDEDVAIGRSKSVTLEGAQ